ncbi:MAG: response regulator, partial [Rhodospirillales bacterium]|nr:response regulator [Rhodospirillales bacterium]
MTSQTTKAVNRILIVDDDPDILKFLVDIFQDQISVSFAPSGAKALEHVQVEKPDLILLDVEMPEMNGFEVCRRLKGDPATQHIPVIFLTAMADSKDMAEGLSLGAVDYITKPIDAQIVIAKVKNQLAHLTPLPAENNERSGSARDRRGEAEARQERRGPREAAPQDARGADARGAAPRDARGADARG